MGFLDTIKDAIGKKVEKRKEEQAIIDRIRLEAEVERQSVLETEMRKHSLEVARAKAKKDAARLSGVQKRRAENRLRNLNKQEMKPTNVFSKLQEYTQKNLARREENLQKTEEVRKSIGKPFKQQTPLPRRKPFEPSRLRRNYHG